MVTRGQKITTFILVALTVILVIINIMVPEPKSQEKQTHNRLDAIFLETDKTMSVEAEVHTFTVRRPPQQMKENIAAGLAVVEAPNGNLMNAVVIPMRDIPVGEKVRVVQAHYRNNAFTDAYLTAILPN